MVGWEKECDWIEKNDCELQERETCGARRNRREHLYMKKVLY